MLILSSYTILGKIPKGKLIRGKPFSATKKLLQQRREGNENQ